MTYDPLSYGELTLRDRAAKPGDTADDILFEDAGPGYAPEPAQPSGWDDLESDMATAGPGGSPQNVTQFGADVLGETMPPVGAPMRPPVAAQPFGQPAMPQPPAMQQPPPPRPAPAAAPRERLPARSRVPVQRPARLMGTLMPTIVVAGGGSAAAWFYMMQQNVVMAAIVGATSLVGAALSRVVFR